MNRRLSGVLNAYIMRPELTSTPLQVAGPALSGPVFELPNGADGHSLQASTAGRTGGRRPARASVKPATADAGTVDGTLDAAEHRASHPEQYAADDGLQPAADAEPAGMAGQLAHSGIRRFVTGGRAIFTLVGASGRYTFKVTRADDKPAAVPSRYGPTYFVALLTGPDNTADYTYAGLLQLADGTIRLTAKSRYTADSTPVKAFNWVMGRVWRGESIEPARVLQVGRCGRCGRALTVPSSIESGFGPECLGKIEGGE